MILRSLHLINLRNYSELELDFSNLVIFVGPNGAGKTNIIEAIYILSTGKSYRTKDDFEVIKWGENYAKVIGEVDDDKLEVIFNLAENQQKIMKINKVKSRSSELLGKLKIVLFSPESIEIITGSPKIRRRFLDLILGQMDKKYLLFLIELQKILKNRNHLLYNISLKRNKPNELSFWDQKLIEASTYLISERKKLINFINNKINFHHQSISEQNSSLKLKYISTVKDLDYFADLLSKNRDREIMHSTTLFGPHRDDIEFILQNKNVNSFASRGEVRSIIFALKMAELEFLSEKGNSPLLLLDDIFSELDKNHRDKLGGIIDNQPTVITTTDEEFINEKLRKKAKIIRLG